MKKIFLFAILIVLGFSTLVNQTSYSWQQQPQSGPKNCNKDSDCGDPDCWDCVNNNCLVAWTDCSDVSRCRNENCPDATDRNGDGTVNCADCASLHCITNGKTYYCCCGQAPPPPCSSETDSTKCNIHTDCASGFKCIPNPDDSSTQACTCKKYCNQVSDTTYCSQIGECPEYLYPKGSTCIEKTDPSTNIKKCDCAIPSPAHTPTSSP